MSNHMFKSSDINLFTLRDLVGRNIAIRAIEGDTITIIYAVDMDTYDVFIVEEISNNE